MEERSEASSRSSGERRGPESDAAERRKDWIDSEVATIRPPAAPGSDSSFWESSVRVRSMGTGSSGDEREREKNREKEKGG